MLIIAGAIDFSFAFPADLATTMNFFDGLERLIEYMPLIELVKPLGPNEYRVVYSATEMGAYHIRLFADVKTDFRRDEGRLLILPTRDHVPEAKRATFNASTGQGFYASESCFSRATDSSTQIDFRLELKGQLPRPKGLRFMPDSVVTAIANNVTDKRVREIADGFIANALAAFPAWLSARNGGHAL